MASRKEIKVQQLQYKVRGQETAETVFIVISYRRSYENNYATASNYGIESKSLNTFMVMDS